MMQNVVKKPPFVSIIIPLYDAESFIRDTIESALRQSYENFELIIIDDQSHDRSAEIAREYLSDRRVCIYENKNNCGVSHTRNHGIRLAQGDFIALLDSDDIWLPHYLETQICILVDHPDIALLGCDFDFIDESGNDITPQEVKEARKNRGDTTTLTEYSINDLFETSPLIPSTWLAKRDTFHKTGLFKEHLKVCEDHEVILGMCMLGRICETRDIMVLYRKHPNQLTSKDELFLEFRVAAFESFVKNFPKAPVRIGLSSFNYRMGGLHQTAGDHYFWNKQNYKKACSSYVRSLHYSTRTFSRWRNFLFALLPCQLHRFARKILGR